MFRNEQKPSRGRVVAALAVACALGAATLAAAEGRTPAKPQDGRTVVNQVKVTSNPATGKIKQSTPAEARVLDEAIASLPTRNLRSAQATQHADGSVSITNDGSLMNYALVRINADGSVSQACVDDAAAADAFLNGAAPAAEVQ
jgi:hypothetical protein